MRDKLKTLLLLTILLFCASLCCGQDLVWQSPTPSASEATAILRAVCPRSIEPGRGYIASSSVCRPCPAYTGELIGGSLALGTVIYGSFTAPGVEEAIASFDGCESHAAEYGGSIFLKKVHGSWAMVDYSAGWITTACRTYRLKNGRDLLLCEWEDHHMDGASYGISVSDLTRDIRTVDVFHVFDNRPKCRPSAVWASIDKAEMHDLNGDGMPDLTLEISVGQGTFPEGSCGAATAGVPLEKQRLDFLFQPDKITFVPTPDSKTRINRLAALYKDVWDRPYKPDTSDSTH